MGFLQNILGGIGEKNKAKTAQMKAFNQQEALKKRGVISPLGEVKSAVSAASLPNINWKGLLQGILSKPTEQLQATPPVPTATPMPTPMIRNNRVEPISPQDIPQTYYTNRNQKIEPKLWDAISTASPTGDLALNDYMKRMALALTTQESGGGYQLSGDNGKSNGPYHIQRADVPLEQRMDPVASTNLVFQEMLRNMMKNNVPKERSLRTWNWNSGYGNNGPKYNVDIPQMATTSSFYKAQ